MRAGLAQNPVFCVVHLLAREEPPFALRAFRVLVQQLEGRECAWHANYPKSIERMSVNLLVLPTSKKPKPSPVLNS